MNRAADGIVSRTASMVKSVPPIEPIRTRGDSPLWNRALERCIEELDGDIDDDLLVGVNSLEDLIVYARTIEPPTSNSFTAFSRLGSTLKFVDDFSALVAICLGADAKVTAFVWGSLRLIITLASSTEDTLQNMFDMLEEISLSLPRLRHYEENLPLDRSLENTLVDLYAEIICFYARLIRYYKKNPHLAMQEAGWRIFERDFTGTVRRVKRLSSIVEKEVDLIKMKVESSKYEEVLEALRIVDDRRAEHQDAKQCYYIPKSSSPRFKARDEDMTMIREALNPSKDSEGLKSLALSGMGGVGKTQLALHYASNSKDIFDTILWISADSRMSFDQSFKEAAAALGLLQETTDGNNELSATARVKEWLCSLTSGCRWLVIFDNADDITLLHHVWPVNGLGSVLITSRDFNAASMLGATGLCLQPFDEKIGTDVFLQFLGITTPDAVQRKHAKEISLLLGGLPLALDQIACFITMRKLRLQDFLSLYERNSAVIDSRQGFSGYPHSLATVFQMTLERLTGSALHLLCLLACLQPDEIPESLLEEGCEVIRDQDLRFLGNEMDLGDAEQVLLQGALINKNSEKRALSIHRLVQSAVLRKLDDADRRKYFKVAVDILSVGFPETWSKDTGHQKQKWVTSEKYLPHINVLVKKASKTPSIAQEPDRWAELLLRCSWYLYEKEQYAYARSFVQAALRSFTNKANLAYASAIDLGGLVDLDIALPQQALTCFEKGLSIRQSILKPTDPLIAFALNNLALAYTELMNLPKAEELHKQAINIRLQNNSDRIGNSYSNYAVTLLRMGRADDAEKILMQCPSLKNCTDATFLAADNPRFVGDMVLLSRIRRSQGRKDEALRLASKALAWRQKVHGDRFKTCDSMYDVACLLAEATQTAVALDLLNAIVSIASTLDAGEGHAARAEWKASKLLQAQDKKEESLKRFENAVLLRSIVRPSDDTSLEMEEAWTSLVPFMLW